MADYVMFRISKRLPDNIGKTELFLSRSGHTIQFLHSKFHFLWKTYSLVFNDFCNPSATRVSVWTNGERKKYKNC